MKQKLNFILMADIIDSRKKDQQKLMTAFKNVIAEINIQERKKLRSPMTITLGDEFQSVVSNLSSGIHIILQLEEFIISKKLDFKLRYVLVEGEIETPINRKIAHEMLGSGLTDAREMLHQLKESKSRYKVKLQNQKLEEAINHTFTAFQGLINDWKTPLDQQIALKFIENVGYKQIAAEVNREKSVIWKRKFSLKVEEYISLKKVLIYLSKK